MTYLQDKIDTFYKKRNEIYKKPLEKIINFMLSKCKYRNGESLERHNWGENPIRLQYVPDDINSPSFEEDLLNALDLKDNEKSIVELLWGDIQLGKRLQACIIMWISVYILKRPVLYIFRNLTIDQKQLQDDITGTENNNFNIKYIKNLFEEFNDELQEYFKEPTVEYWKDFKLPRLNDINSNDSISKLCNKDAMDAHIFCCLMNHTQLEKINKKFSEYIYYNHELVNITVLVDESDLMSPTSSNDRNNNNDEKDSTKCEILIAKIYKKVKYALHITGTAHSLLYNITTRLSDHTDILIKISKVHKMKRINDYFGLFNNSINFNTTLVESWWDYQDPENHKKKNCYDIVKDYNINIKKIIEELLKRPTIKYNSLLISEEKIRANQFLLVDKIVKDFPNLFIVIYHGNCLRLYLSQNYEKEIKFWSKSDSNNSSTTLWQSGGIYGSSIDTEKSEKLPNKYCYFDINTKIFNIKCVYKLLRILFEKSDTPILCKTIITITGKYGERGYSFTSDDYDNYSLHLTDQYFVSHASFNCTDISQRLRLQGKYNDLELINGSMKLTLWTNPKLQDIIQNFYVKFIKKIEKNIMKYENWEGIKELLESIIDNGNLKFGKYMKYIDVSKKRKNLEVIKHYNPKDNGYQLIMIDDMNDDEITEWCKKFNLPEYICINEIKEIGISNFKNNKSVRAGIPKKIHLIDVDEIPNTKLTNKKHGTKDFLWSKIGYQLEELGFNKENLVNKRLVKEYNPKYEIKNIQTHIDKNIPKQPDSNCKKINDYNLLIVTNDIPEFNCKKGDTFITYYTDQYDIIDKKDVSSNPANTDNIFITNDDNIKYSVLKEEYKQQNNTHEYTNETEDDFIKDNNKFPEKYYWKTPDDCLYLYDKDKPEIISLNIVVPLPVKNDIQPNISTEQLINTDNDILLFANSCCKKTDKKNLRFGIKDIFKKYEIWCKNNNNKCLKSIKKFKEEFEKINYKEEKSKGVDVNNNHGKRGYNIMVSL